MSRPHVRRLAMQILFSIDVSGTDDPQEVFDGLDKRNDDLATRQQALKLALAAWADRQHADAETSALTPDWPIHRQPPVDRAILRLAWHEMRRGHAPGKVAINEAVQLAKLYSNPNAPSFVNGVLDKVLKNTETLHLPDLAPVDADGWLDDATADEAPAAAPKKKKKPGPKPKAAAKPTPKPTRKATARPAAEPKSKSKPALDDDGWLVDEEDDTEADVVDELLNEDLDDDGWSEDDFDSE